MKRINITLSADDEAAIEEVKRTFGITSRSAAIRFAVHAMAGKRGLANRDEKINSHVDSHSQKDDAGSRG